MKKLMVYPYLIMWVIENEREGGKEVNKERVRSIRGKIIMNILAKM